MLQESWHEQKSAYLIYTTHSSIKIIENITNDARQTPAHNEEKEISF